VCVCVCVCDMDTTHVLIRYQYITSMCLHCVLTSESADIFNETLKFTEIEATPPFKKMVKLSLSTS
jgi:hypothetical protein